MALIGSTQTKGFDAPEAYVCISNVTSTKVPFAEWDIQITFRLFKDKATYDAAPNKDDYFLEQFTLFLNGHEVAPENYFTAAYGILKQSERFANFVDA